jgi:hypothetical protein
VQKSVRHRVRLACTLACSKESCSRVGLCARQKKGARRVEEQRATHACSASRSAARVKAGVPAFTLAAAKKRRGRRETRCLEPATAKCEQRHSARAPQRGLRVRVPPSTAGLEPGGRQEDVSARMTLGVDDWGSARTRGIPRGAGLTRIGMLEAACCSCRGVVETVTASESNRPPPAHPLLRGTHAVRRAVFRACARTIPTRFHPDTQCRRHSYVGRGRGEGPYSGLHLCRGTRCGARVCVPLRLFSPRVPLLPRAHTSPGSPRIPMSP